MKKSYKSTSIKVTFTLLIILASVSCTSTRDLFLSEREMLLKGVDMQPGDLIEESDLKTLPLPMVKYLKKTGVVGTRIPNFVEIKQEGEMRMSPEKDWIPFEAEEVYTPGNNQFLWYGKLSMNSVVNVYARDYYIASKGAMRVRVWDFFTVVDARGPAMDQGGAMRYLNEVMWFPQAFLLPYFTFKEIDATTVEVSINLTDRIETCHLIFDEQYRLKNFKGKRTYINEDGNEEFTNWETPLNKWEKRNGLLLPVGGSAVWKLKDGDFEYIRLEVSDIVYQ